MTFGFEFEKKFEIFQQSSNEHYFFSSQQPGADETLQAIFDKMRVAVFKNRVRTIEFFKDYDKLRSGIITENQFVCGLSLAIGKEAQLSRAEIQKVVEYYRQPDDRVRYKEFCDMMENGEYYTHRNVTWCTIED